MKIVNGDLCHDLLVAKAKGKLSFSDERNYDEWRGEVREKLCSLLGLDKIKENSCEPEFEIEEKVEKEGYTRYRFSFYSEIGAVVPCYLLVPNTGKEKYPVAVLVQGHGTGFHLAIGDKKYPKDDFYQPRSSWGIQAVKNGYIALCIEQRCMGERRSLQSYGKDNEYHDRVHMCAVGTLRALALGRTTIGERVWDVSKAIDTLAHFPQADLDKVFISGNSGGGTATYYSACYDERIKISVPSCSFCSFGPSILSIEHCACNYIPNVCEFFDMGDVSTLIAPRSLIVVAGKEDPIFPISGVRDGFETVKKIYEKAGASGNCRLVETPKEHWWCEDIVWDAINAETKRLGW